MAGGWTEDGVGQDRPEDEPGEGMPSMDHGVLYKNHRIHLSHLKSGLWLSQIVSIGERTPVTEDSLTDTVTRVPGEYLSQAEALEAANSYIDRLEIE